MFYEQDYDRYLHSIGRLQSTRQIHGYTLKDLVGFLSSHGVIEAKAVTTVHITEFTRCLVARGYCAKTLGNHLMRVRMYFAFLQEQKIIFLSPAAGLRIPRSQGGHRPCYTDGEINARLEKFDTSTAIGLRARTILELGYSAALRPREIRALKLADIDRSRGVLFIEQSKNRKDRVVPVGMVALQWIDRYVSEVRSTIPGTEDHPHIFVSHKDGEAISARGLTWAVAEACHQAGIESIQMYSMRTSAATNLLDAGMGVAHISRLLGHASIRTTQIYLHSRERELAAVVAANHPRFRFIEGGIPA